MSASIPLSSIRKLFLHFGQFFGTGMLLLLLGFVTFPILTRLLTREEYGILGLVTNTIAIAVAIAKGGLSESIIRFYREYTVTPERLTLFTSTVLTRGVLLAGIVVGVYVFALPLINRLIGVDPRYLRCFLIMAVYLFARPLNIIVMNYMRALGKIFLLNVVNAVMKIAEVAIAFTLLLWLIGDLYGYFLGIALAQIGATVFLYRWLLTNHRFSIAQVSGTLTFDLLKFGLPLLLTELAYLLLSYTDRYMIVAYHGQAVLGLYTVGYNVPSYVNDMVMFSLSYAVVPIYTELYAREGKEATETFLSRSLNYYFMAMIPLCVGYA
ncbi:MAG: oligosaccharide flippase family protein, partial [Burkholderiales bacterium]